MAGWLVGERNGMGEYIGRIGFGVGRWSETADMDLLQKRGIGLVGHRIYRAIFGVLYLICELTWHW